MAPVLSHNISSGSKALGTIASSVMKFLIQTPSLEASAAAMYSASRSRDHALLAASPYHSSSIQNINVSCLRFRIILVGVETSIDITFYDELFITSID